MNDWAQQLILAAGSLVAAALAAWAWVLRGSHPTTGTEECTCRNGGQPVAIQAWELGDTLETGATGPVIDHRCPTCWLPRLTRTAALREWDRLTDLEDLTAAQIDRMERLADFVEATNPPTPQPPATGGVRFGGERQALIFTDANAGEHQVYVARLLDGTTRTFPTMQEAKDWILSTRSPERRNG